MPDLVTVAERLGIPFAIVVFICFLVWKFFVTFLPLWKEKAEAQNLLTKTLADEVPNIGKNTERTLTATKELGERMYQRMERDSRAIEEIREHISKKAE